MVAVVIVVAAVAVVAAVVVVAVVAAIARVSLRQPKPVGGNNGKNWQLLLLLLLFNGVSWCLCVVLLLS